MISNQIMKGYDDDGYPIGWRSRRMRKLQTEILWLQQRGRCAISGEQIILGRDKIARHHIEFIKSKSGIRHLVLVLDKYHGAIKESTSKQDWIDTLLLAKKYLERGRPPKHWKHAERSGFMRDTYGRFFDKAAGIYKSVYLWRSDLRYYITQIIPAN